MGLAVAQALSSREDENWDLHIIDLNEETGKQVASGLKNAHFHRTDVTDYPGLVAAFEATWSISGRLDFVYANAGVVERGGFFTEHPLDTPPPPPDQSPVDINLKAVVNTAWLALHYFRKSLQSHGKEGSDPVLIMTASCGGLYPSEYFPIYSASKAAVIQLNRAIQNPFHDYGIRTFATCPGTIRTGLLSSEGWSIFPEEFLTPMKTLVDTVLKLINGGDIQDSNGRKVSKQDNWGLAVEVFKQDFFIRDQAEWCNDGMKDMMALTKWKPSS